MQPVSPGLIDYVHINTAIFLFVLGLVVHWIRKVNKMFTDFEKLRYENEKRLAEVTAELNEHIAVSAQVWQDVGRRLNHLEGNGYRYRAPHDPER